MIKQCVTSRPAAVVFLAAALGAATIGVNAQAAFDPPLAQRPLAAATAAPPISDEDFARIASMANTNEIAEARLALQRTQSPRVRAFAQRMIDDHSTAQVQLQAANRGTGLMPAPVLAVSPADKAEYDALTNAGSDFDARYMLAQVPDHQNAVAAFGWEAANGKDASLRAYAVKTLPIVQQHLRLVQTFVATNGASLGLLPNDSSAVINPPGRGATGNQMNGPANNPATGTNGQTQGQNSAPNTVTPAPRPN
jgi:putative membrane protein